MLIISLFVGQSSLLSMNTEKVLRIIQGTNQNNLNQSFDDQLDHVCDPCLECCLEGILVVRELFNKNNLVLLYHAIMAENPKEKKE